MRYIADKYEHQGTPNLHGSTLQERAHVQQWMDVEMATFAPIVQPILYQLLGQAVYKKPADEVLVAERTEKLVVLLDIYEAQLAKHRYLAAEFVTLADLAHVPLAYIYFNVMEKRELLESRPRVAAWLAELFSRPSWKKIAATASPDYESWVEGIRSFNASQQ